MSSLASDLEAAARIGADESGGVSAADLEGATHLRMPSGAGHDAMMLARHVPSGMLFVPSLGGISHSPDAYTAPEQCELGARVLARALEILAGRSQSP